MRLATFVTILDGALGRNDCTLNYRGKTNVTRNGVKCQKWNANKPHEPNFTPKGNTDHNYCRNPDNDVKGPWCYTTDPKKRFDYCNVDDCNVEPDVKCWRPDHDFRAGLEKKKFSKRKLT